MKLAQPVALKAQHFDCRHDMLVQPNKWIDARAFSAKLLRERKDAYRPPYEKRHSIAFIEVSLKFSGVSDDIIPTARD